MSHRILVPSLVLLAAAAAVAYWVYQVDPHLCNGCRNCIPWCPEGAISMNGPDAWIDPEICTGCGDCVYHCPRGAIYREWYTGTAGEETVPEVSVHPNPSAGIVQVSGTAEGQLLHVFDVTGRIVYHAVSPGEGFTLDLSRCGGGLYVVYTDGVQALLLTVIR